MNNQADTKDDWLRIQEEVRHRNVVNVYQGLALTPSLYFGTRRCTYSDVVSMVTTVKPLPRFAHEASLSPTTKAKKLHQAKAAWEALPVKHGASRQPEQTEDTVSQYVQAPLEGDSERSKRFLARQSFALTQERKVFMATLHSQRWQRFQREHQAALVVQRVYRGFLLRRRFMAIKEKLRVRKRIRVNLVKVTKGTAIITGEKDRKARILKQQNDAARKIQFCFARWRGRRLLQREREVQIHEMRRKKAVLIQRMWRRALVRAAMRKLRARFLQQQQQRLANVLARVFQGYQTRQRVRKIRLLRQVQASQRIQDAVVSFHARKALGLQRRRRIEEMRNRAAVVIQRLARGVLARQRVTRIRIQEDHAIRVACVLAIQRTFRGFLGRRRMRYHRVFHAHTLAWQCGVHLTRIVRGFLGRQRVKLEKLEQETDLLVQTTKGNTSTVIDLLDGYGLVDEAVDMTVVNFDTKNNMLHLAAKHGRMEIVTHVLPKFLEQAPEMIYAVNKRGETPLELAVCNGHEKIASFLLTKTADLFPQFAKALHNRRVQGGHRERSLVLEAARYGMGSIVNKLIVLFPQHFDGKEKDAWSKRTLLHEALLLPRDRYEDNKTVSINNETIYATLNAILSKINVDVNAQDLVGFTPLHVAAMLGNLKAVKLLLEYGADVSLKDKEDRTAWRLALLFGHEACFLEIRRKWLSDVSTGATTSKTAPDDESDTAKALVDAATKSRGSNRHFLASLQPHLAKDLLQLARKGDNDRVKFLIEDFHANVNACDPSGDNDSLLMVVLGEKNVRLLRYLLSSFADVLELGYVNKSGRSVMDMALQSPLLMRMLIRHGRANPCLPLDNIKQHRTASHEAVRRGYNLRDWLHGYAFMPAMLVPLVDDTGRTPLHDAAAFGNTSSAKLLLHAGLRVDHQDTVEKRTSLHEACRSGNLVLVRKMVSACSSALWICDAAGHTPVVDASVSGSREVLAFVVAQMMRADRDPDEKTKAFEALGKLLQDNRHAEATGAVDLASVLENVLNNQQR